MGSLQTDIDPSNNENKNEGKDKLIELFQQRIFSLKTKNLQKRKILIGIRFIANF